MTTLDDIIGKGREKTYVPENFVSVELLKQEAIKWLKKDIEDWNKGPLFQSTMIKRWKDRFNITEEDLQ